MKKLGYLLIAVSAALFAVVLISPIGHIQLSQDEERCSWHWAESSQFWVLMTTPALTKDVRPFRVLVNEEVWVAHEGGPLNSRGNRVNDRGPRAEGKQCFSLQVGTGLGNEPDLSVYTSPRHLSDHQENEIGFAAIFFFLFWGCLLLLWAKTRNPRVMAAAFGIAALGAFLSSLLQTDDTILPTDGVDTCFLHLFERDRSWRLRLKHPVNGELGKPFRVWMDDVLLFERPSPFQLGADHSAHLAYQKVIRGKQCFRLETQEGVGEIPLIEVSARGTLLGTMYEKRLLMILLFFNLACAIGFILWSHLGDRKLRPPPASGNG